MGAAAALWLLLPVLVEPLAARRGPRRGTRAGPSGAAAPAAPAEPALRRVTTSLGANCSSFYVLEVADPAWWRASTAAENPYGAKLWPGALAAAERLAVGVAAGRGVVEIGCGNGFASLAAAACAAPARRVLATDVSSRALDLTRRAAEEQRLGGVVAVARFDVCGPEPLPAGYDVLVAADVLYDAALARCVARRVVEARGRGMDVVVGGSPDREGRDAFLAALRDDLDPGVAFEPGFDVEHAELKWQRKRVEVLHLAGEGAS